MRKHLGLSLVLLVVSCIRSASLSNPHSNANAPPQSTSAGSVSGNVTLEDAVEGQSIGIAVKLIGSDTTHTVGNGNYKLANVAPGTYKLTAHRKGYEPVTVSDITVHGGQHTRAPAIVLPVLRGDIRGSVALATEGDPRHVKLSLAGTPYATIATAAGTFRFVGVPVGKYQLTARLAGYASSIVGNVTVTADTATQISGITLGASGKVSYASVR